MGLFDKVIDTVGSTLSRVAGPRLRFTSEQVSRPVSLLGFADTYARPQFPLWRPLGGIGRPSSAAVEQPVTQRIAGFAPARLQLSSSGRLRAQAEPEPLRQLRESVRAQVAERLRAVRDAVGGTRSPEAALRQQIGALAEREFGPEGRRIVEALLVAEGGLGGAVGDRDISPIGSHGPFQFYGTPESPGQLNRFAAHLGVDLATAGRIAREQPLYAAEWAFQNYLGQALREGLAQGLRDEALLRHVLRVQNPGALGSLPHYERYIAALRGITLPPAPTEGPLSAVPPGQLAQQVLATARGWVGTPYRWGGAGPEGADCSGFIVATMQAVGRPFPPGVRDAESIRRYSVPVPFEAAQPGDLIFFHSTYGEFGPDYATHVGIVTDRGVMLDANDARGTVDFTQFWENPYWRSRILEIRRPPQYFEGNPTGEPQGVAAPAPSAQGQPLTPADAFLAPLEAPPRQALDAEPLPLQGVTDALDAVLRSPLNPVGWLFPWIDDRGRDVARGILDWWER